MSITKHTLDTDGGIYQTGMDIMLGPFGQQPGDIPLAVDWDGN